MTTDNSNSSAPRRGDPWRGRARLLVTLAGLAACCWGIRGSGREGLAQLFASYGAAAGRPEAAERAVRLSPSAPEVHYVRATLLSNRGALAEAAVEMERAVALRPRDYALWLDLGRVRDEGGDAAGALKAFQESARLAPFYARPRWQLGNALYREGRTDEAFAELRRAALSDPELLPQVLNLAWASASGDPQAVERVIQPETARAHLALARLFVRRGKVVEAARHFRSGGDQLSDEERGGLVQELLAGKHFAAAYEVWSAGRTTEAGQDPLVLNRGFEETIRLGEPGFGWQLPQGLKAFAAAQDVAEPRAGQRSLRLTWDGNADTAPTFVSQLVLVGPRASYRLSFAARTREVVSAGLPLVAVTEAGDAAGEPLGRPVVLPQGTSPWQDYAVEFQTNEATGAVLISVRRQGCPNSPCPIFGQVWLDDFSIRKTSP